MHNKTDLQSWNVPFIDHHHHHWESFSMCFIQIKSSLNFLILHQIIMFTKLFCLTRSILTFWWWIYNDNLSLDVQNCHQSQMYMMDLPLISTTFHCGGIMMIAINVLHCRLCYLISSVSYSRHERANNTWSTDVMMTFEWNFWCAMMEPVLMFTNGSLWFVCFSCQHSFW